MARRAYVLPVLGVAVLAGVALAVIGARALRTPDAILGVFPVDGERAAVVVSSSGLTHASIVLALRTGERVWRSELGAYEPWIEEHRGVAVAGDLLTLRLAGARTVAHALTDGARRWVFDGAGQSSGPPPGAAMLGDDHQEIEVYDAENTVVVAVDRTAGTEQWRWRAAGEPRAARRLWLRAARLVIERGTGLELIDRANGHSVRIENAPAPCVLDDAAYYIDATGALHRVVLAGATDAIAIADLPAALHADARPARLAGLCGQRQDQTILAIDLGEGRSLIAGLAPDGASVSWTIDLGARTLSPGAVTVDAQMRFRYPDIHPLAAHPARFVPLLTKAPSRDGEAPPLALTVVDLERHEVAWRSRVDAALRHGYVIAHGGRGYLVAGAALVAFDDTTGHLRRAVRVEGALDIQPHDLAGGHVWVHDPRHAGVLDAVTLDMLPPADDMHVIDVTAEFAALGTASTASHP